MECNFAEATSGVLTEKGSVSLSAIRLGPLCESVRNQKLWSRVNHAHCEGGFAN